MYKANFGHILGKNQLSQIKLLVIIFLPVIGILIDSTISDFINGGSLFSNFNLHLFVYVAFLAWGYIIFKKFKDWKNGTGKSSIRNGLKQTILSNSSLHIKKDDVLTGPLVRLEENTTDIFLTFRMPYGLSKEAYKKSKDLFENVIGYPVIKITETQNDVVFVFKKAEKDLSTDYLYQQENKVILGYDTYSEPIWWEPLQEPHLIVAAGTGGGKTVYLQSIVLQLKNITKNLTFVDFKGNEFGPLEDYGYKVHTTLNGVLDTLRELNEIMQDRQNLLKEKRFRDYTKLDLEPHYIIFDEYAQLIAMFPNTKEGKAEKQEFESLLGSIARLGRSAGIYAILSMQQPNANTLDTEIRDNMMTKVAIRGANPTVQTMIFNERAPDIETKLDYGNHIIKTGNGYEVIKVPYYQGDFFEDMNPNIKNAV